MLLVPEILVNEFFYSQDAGLQHALSVSMVSMMDVRDAHGYVYIVKASTNRIIETSR